MPPTLQRQPVSAYSTAGWNYGDKTYFRDIVIPQRGMLGVTHIPLPSLLFVCGLSLQEGQGQRVLKTLSALLKQTDLEGPPHHLNPKILHPKVGMVAHRPGISAFRSIRQEDCCKF